MRLKKNEILDTLNISVKELQEKINLHSCLVTSIVENQINGKNWQSFFDLCPKRSREIVLENALKNAIDVLEESRKAFKSKKLEILRRNLTHVLIDT